jgi:hypothetical protein
MKAVFSWIHANRAIDKIIPFTDAAKKDLPSLQTWVMNKVSSP